MLKLDSLKTLHVGEHRNVVHGTIDHTLCVSVRREMRGWTGYIVVIVGGEFYFADDGGITHRNGHVFHDFEASESDKMAFDTLMERAHAEVDARRDRKRESVIKQARASLV